MSVLNCFERSMKVILWFTLFIKQTNMLTSLEYTTYVEGGGPTLFAADNYHIYMFGSQAYPDGMLGTKM